MWWEGFSRRWVWGRGWWGRVNMYYMWAMGGQNVSAAPRWDPALLSGARDEKEMEKLGVVGGEEEEEDPRRRCRSAAHAVRQWCSQPACATPPTPPLPPPRSLLQPLPTDGILPICKPATARAFGGLSPSVTTLREISAVRRFTREKSWIDHVLIKQGGVRVGGGARPTRQHKHAVG